MTDFYITPGGAGSGVFGWADATDIAGLKGIAEGLVVPGGNLFTHGGSYTLPVGGIDTARSGTTLLPVSIIGVTPGTTREPPTPADWATGTDRPLFEAGAQPFVLPNYWQVRNLRQTSTSANVFQVGASALIQNYQGISDTPGITPGLQFSGSGGRLLNSEISNPGGIGVLANSSSIMLKGSYIHDCGDRGIHVLGNAAIIDHTIIDTCPIGLEVEANDRGQLLNSIIYNCPLGIDGINAGNAFGWQFLSNIIDSCLVGAEWMNEVLSNHWDYNNWSNNGTDVINVTKGPNALALDPQFVNAAGGDFRIGPNLFGKGFGSGLGFGSPSVPNTGPWQGTPRRVAVPVPDLSEDHFLLDGLEGVSLRGLAIESAYRRDLETQEASPSNAAYIQGDVQWDLPTVTEPGGAASPAPKVGDTITDDLTGTSYTVLSVREPWLDDYYGCHSRELRIVTDTSLRDLISWYPVKVVTNSFGSRIATHPAAHPDFTDIPARVQIQPVSTIDTSGKRQFERIFWIYSSKDVPVQIGDLFRDQEMNWYEILSWDPRETIDSFPKYVVRFKN